MLRSLDSYLTPDIIVNLVKLLSCSGAICRCHLLFSDVTLVFVSVCHDFHDFLINLIITTI